MGHRGAAMRCVAGLEIGKKPAMIRLRIGVGMQRGVGCHELDIGIEESIAIVVALANRKRSQQGASAVRIECIRARLHSMMIVSVRYAPKFFAPFEDYLAYNLTRFAMAIAASSRASAALARRMQRHNRRWMKLRRRLELAYAAGKLPLDIHRVVIPVNRHRKRVGYEEVAQPGLGAALA